MEEGLRYKVFEARSRALFGVPGVGFDVVYCWMGFGRLGVRAVVFGFGAWVNGMVCLDVHLLKAGKGMRLLLQGISTSWDDLCGVQIVIRSCGGHHER